jgi:hypothetical protein
MYCGKLDKTLIGSAQYSSSECYTLWPFSHNDEMGRNPAKLCLHRVELVVADGHPVVLEVAVCIELSWQLLMNA